MRSLQQIWSSRWAMATTTIVPRHVAWCVRRAQRPMLRLCSWWVARRPMLWLSMASCVAMRVFLLPRADISLCTSRALSRHRDIRCSRCHTTMASYWQRMLIGIFVSFMPMLRISIWWRLECSTFRNLRSLARSIRLRNLRR